MASCEMMDDGVAQRETERLGGVGLKHKVISVRPLVGILGRSRSNSSAARRSAVLYLEVGVETQLLDIGTRYGSGTTGRKSLTVV